MKDAPGDETRSQATRFERVGRNTAHLIHQIRSRVVTIGLLAQSLHARIEPDSAPCEELGRMIDNVTELEKMLDEALSFVKPAKANRERINVAKLLELLASDVSAYADDLRVELAVNAPKRLPGITGSRRLLKEALRNVVINGIDAAAGEAEAAVNLVGRCTAKNLIVEVIDNGPGIPTGVVRRACEPFYTTKNHGTGLGLPVAKKIVEEHGGRLTISSHSGKGTRIAARFPLQTDRDSS